VQGKGEEGGLELLSGREEREEKSSVYVCLKKGRRKNIATVLKCQREVLQRPVPRTGGEPVKKNLKKAGVC